VLAHEMQHALDYKQGLMVSQPKMPSLRELQKLSNDDRQKLADSYAKWYESRLGSEFRAFERGNSIENNDAYNPDHAKMSKFDIFTSNTIKTDDGYEGYYEGEFAKNSHGAEIDLKWSNGKMTANIIVPTPKKNTLWKLW
jgi:hypothetical protein